jgi:hypothetical protein
MAADSLLLLVTQLCTVAGLPAVWPRLQRAGYSADLLLRDPAGVSLARLTLEAGAPIIARPTTAPPDQAPAAEPRPAAAASASAAKAVMSREELRQLFADAFLGAMLESGPPSPTDCATCQYWGQLVIHWAFGHAVALRLGAYVCVVQENTFRYGDPRYGPTDAFLDTIDGGSADAQRHRRAGFEFQRCWERVFPASVLAAQTNGADWLAAMYERRALLLLPMIDAVREERDSSAWNAAFLRRDLEPDEPPAVDATPGDAADPGKV